MNDIINEYIILLSLLNKMDLDTLNDIKYIGNLKKKNAKFNLNLLKLIPKCNLKKTLIDNEIAENLQMQSKLAFWTFQKIQQDLGCTTLFLENEPSNEEEQKKLYDYFYHLILINDKKTIKNVINLNGNMVFVDEDSNLYSDNCKSHILMNKCNSKSVLSKINMILKELGINQSVDINTNKFLNVSGPLLYSDIDTSYFICDLHKTFNILAVYEDGTVRHIKTDNFGNYKEFPCKSLKTALSKDNEMSRVRTLN